MLHLASSQIGQPRLPDEGIRIGAVRYLPRGVKKTDYARRDYFDVWLPALAPSRELLGSYQDGELTVKQFYSRYRKEMQATDPRQVIALLARMAAETPLSIACYCDDPERCHRTALVELIRGASQA